MRERLGATLGEAAAKDLFAGTFHRCRAGPGEGARSLWAAGARRLAGSGLSAGRRLQPAARPTQHQPPLRRR